MGVTTFTDEYSSPFPRSRMFKAATVDSHNLFPKLMPQFFKSIEFIQGDGGAGSIKQYNFAEGHPIKSLKHHVDELNEQAFTYGFTLIDGSSLADKLEKITYKIKFEEAGDGGTVSKVTRKYFTAGDFTLKDEEVKASKERDLAMYKAVEAFLAKNPDAYV